jgi:hypothetical protein
MSKTNYFSSKSVFGQLISLIDNDNISKAVKKHESDRFAKKYTTKDPFNNYAFLSICKVQSIALSIWRYA